MPKPPHPDQDTGYVNFKFENSTKHVLTPGFFMAYNTGTAGNSPHLAPAFKSVYAGYFNCNKDGLWGALVLYGTPDPYFDLAVLFAQELRTGEPARNLVKTTFLPSDTQLEDANFYAVYGSSRFVGSAEHRYTIGDGKQHKLIVTGSVDQNKYAKADFKLQHFVWEKKVA